MKRVFCIFITVLLGASLLVPVACFAEEQPPAAPAATEAAPPAESQPAPETAPQPETTQAEKPMLTDIAFSGAQLNSGFQKDVFEYELIVSDHTSPIRPSSYKATDYNAMVQVNYLTNTSGDAIGLLVRVFNQAGANEYKFLFDSIQEIKKTPDASLLGLNFDFGELSPAFDAAVFRYTLYLPSDLEVLNINAVASDENAKINTPSQITLNPGQPSPIAIKVVSSDGTNTATYKLNIKRVDKTIAQIKTEMENPNFISFVEIPFYRTAPFYIISGVSVFLIALALVLFFTLRRKKAVSGALDGVDTAAEAAALQTEQPKENGELVAPAAGTPEQEPEPAQTESAPPSETKKSKKTKKKAQPEAQKTEEPASAEKAEQAVEDTAEPEEQSKLPQTDKKPAPPEEPAAAPVEEVTPGTPPAPTAEKAAPPSPAEIPPAAPAPQPSEEPPAALPPNKKRRSIFKRKEKNQAIEPIAASTEEKVPVSEPDAHPGPPVSQTDTKPAVQEGEPKPAAPKETAADKNVKKVKDPAINDQAFGVNGLDLDKYKKYK